MRNGNQPLKMACGLFAGALAAQADYTRPEAPFAPAAGHAGTTAVGHSDERIAAWATDYANYEPGSDVDESWQQPEEALGEATAGVNDVVVLGRGGSITLTFDRPIINGDGFDFAVFENAFSDTFLELAYVEVSSDGVHFARFPSYSLTAEPVGAFGTLDPTLIHGLAGKYRAGYGTPFDLQDLVDAHTLAVEREIWRGPEQSEFSQEYRDALVAAFAHLDPERITHIRVVDVVGDGSRPDSEGFAVYDQYPTVITAGFDLDGVAALNVRTAAGEPQPQHLYAGPIRNVVAGEGPVELDIRASSGLPVSMEILDGPSGLRVDADKRELVPGMATGPAELRLYQEGNDTFAPADDLILPLRIVSAEEEAAPQSFGEYADENPELSGEPAADSDGDGVLDLMEFIGGGDPLLADAARILSLEAGDPTAARAAMLLQLAFNPAAKGRAMLESSTDGASWSLFAPRLVRVETMAAGGHERHRYVYEVEPPASGGRFLRLLAQP